MRAVILAGGKGTRLRPYTTVLPKPLMPIGQQPIVEVVIRQLHHYGFDRITLALGHLAHLIKAVLENGHHPGVQVDYSLEEGPLGTTGPLALIKDLDDTFLVMNGDVLTDLNFRDIIHFHHDQQAIATIVIHRRTVRIDYGVLQRSGFKLLNYQEKPSIDYEVSTGIYVFSRKILDYVPPYAFLDFPDLVKTLIENDEKVICYPFSGTWYDLGRVEDFNHVNRELETLKTRIPFIH
ncbi:MAG: sugar phosphate nucleotidyltransferase [Thermodesulfobacteriota bacterium]|jgi:NDP-sugar pyrophosphorylase family protein